MILNLTLCCLAIVLSSLVGGLLPMAAGLTHTRLQLYLSFAAGTMLGAAFFHMMPAAVAIGSEDIFGWTAAGLLTLFFLERFFSYHHHEPPEVRAALEGERSGHSHGEVQDQAVSTPGHHTPTAIQAPTLNWWAATIGLAVHSLIGGLALASAVAADYGELGRFGVAAWGVWLATLIHKPADALTVVSLMKRAHSKPMAAHAVNLGFSLMIPIGALLFFLGTSLLEPNLSGRITASALAFSAGTFLCIALSDLLPELHFHAHDRFKLSAALLLGIALMAAASLGEPEDTHGHGHHHGLPSEAATDELSEDAAHGQ